MQAVIFCGGRGTRITGSGPKKKELFEIGGYPILWHIMKIFATYGCKDFVLPLGYRGDLIRRYFLEYERMTRDISFELSSSDRVSFIGGHPERDWRVTLIDTGVDTTKGERVRRIAPHITGERFFLTYGDGVSDIDLDALLDFHRGHGKWITVTGYQPRYQYGIVEAGDDGLVTAYHQYPRLDHWINAGFMVVERDALHALEPGLDWETGFMVRLASTRQLAVYRHDGFWRKMDTYKEAQELNGMWTSGMAPWKTW